LPAEQIEVTGLVDDAPVRGRERKRPPRVAVLTERARDGDETIANHRGLQVVACLPEGGSERVAERVRVLSREVFMATAEDMIVTKLLWAMRANRAKDRDDVRNIIAVRGADLDWDYIEGWCATHGTITLLGEIRHSIPPV
jgi:hypothetical protein